MSLREIIPQSFTSLLSLFGISLRGERDNSFVLTGDVVPTVLVGSIAAIQAIATDAVRDLANSTGEVAAPAAGTVMADTGPLAEGTWAIAIEAGKLLGGGNQFDFRVQRRDAANAVSVWTYPVVVAGSANETYSSSFVCRLLAGERVRAITASLGSGTCQVAIFASRVS